MTRARGFALIIVLWAVVLLALLATQLTGAGRTEANLAGNLRGAAEASAEADGQIYRTIWQLLQGPGRPGTTREAIPGGRATVTLGSEDGKFDLNGMSAEAFAALLRAVGVARAQATQLAGDMALWRYPSAQTEVRRRDYAAAGLAYGPPGSPFQSVAELGLVLGMTPAIEAAVRPYLTVFHAGDPILSLADPLVREVARATGVRPADDRQAGSVWDIDVAVQTNGGSRASRHAVVRVGAAADHGGWRILDWR